MSQGSGTSYRGRLGENVHATLQEVFYVQLEDDEIQKVTVGGQVHEEVEIAGRGGFTPHA